MNIFHAFNVFDWVLVILILLFSIYGFFDGFLANFLKLLTWICGFIISYFFANDLKDYFLKYANANLSYTLSFIIILLLILVLGWIIKFFILKYYAKDKFNFANRIFGFLLGFLKSLVVIVLLIEFLDDNNSMKDYKFWQNSKLVKVVSGKNFNSDNNLKLKDQEIGHF